MSTFDLPSLIYSVSAVWVKLHLGAITKAPTINEHSYLSADSDTEALRCSETFKQCVTVQMATYQGLKTF